LPFTTSLLQQSCAVWDVLLDAFGVADFTSMLRSVTVPQGWSFAVIAAMRMEEQMLCVQ
jgi:hypothetical protein